MIKKCNGIIFKDDFAILKIQDSLKGELDCLIDIDDIEKIKNYFWRIRYDRRHPNCTLYVESHSKGKRLHLHRFITNCPSSMVVDHINGNGLDNRKQNLRVVTQQQNCLNKNHKKDVGVFYNKRDDNWIAYISIKGRMKYLGYYKNRESALKRREYANKLIKNGEFYNLERLKCDKLKGRH